MRLTALLCFVTLICLRLPDVVLNGRFWAEEGNVFFRYAFDVSWYQALLHSYGGYLNIVANTAGLLAHILVPLEYAPYVTIVIGLFFQVCPAILLVTSRVFWLRPRWAIPLALLIVATQPTSQEVWLQTLHCQFQLALCGGLILAMETETTVWLRWFKIVLLVLGPLSGPASIALLPFFILRGLIDRNGDRWIQTAALALGTTLQIGLFFVSDPGRSSGIRPSLLACVMVVRHVLIPFLGSAQASVLAESLRTYILAGHRPWLVVTGSIFSFGVWTLAAVWVGRRAAAWLIVPALVVAALSYYGAAGNRGDLLIVWFGPRYSFMPQALLGLSLLALTAEANGILSKVALGAGIWIAVIGLHEYFISPSMFMHGANWQMEVALWRANPSHLIQIWPAGWTVDLPVASSSPGG